MTRGGGDGIVLISREERTCFFVTTRGGWGNCLFCDVFFFFGRGNRLDVIVTNLILSCLPAVDVAAAALGCKQKGPKIGLE